MKKRLITLAAGILAILSFNTSALEPKGFPDVKKLDFMVGHWAGPSWMLMREGRVDSYVKEDVNCKWDCEILVINGQAIKPATEGQEATVVHSALGIIRFDPTSQQYVMQAYAQGRGMIEAPITLTGERSFEWQMELPHNSGHMRYTVDFSEDGKWKEIGEYSRDGENWHKSMEMTLTRQ